MKILQVLPSLESGGVERGTLDLARELVRRGHQSLVISSGGRLVPRLQAEGSVHIPFPVQRKSPISLLRVPALRRLLDELAPDVIHVRSRLPAWMVRLAVGRRPPGRRPALVSTFHGLYSVSRYSAVMGRGDRVIAISDCVREYIQCHYPEVDPARIVRIHRGVDIAQFPAGYRPPGEWERRFFEAYPELRDTPLLLMPGRLSRWKGQLEFLDMLSALRAQGVACHGLVVGEADPGREAYRDELRRRAADPGLAGGVTFLDHRDDMAELYAIAAVVCNLSRQPEPFGRTVIEALALGRPVVAWDAGGPAESLREALPAGLVPAGDMDALVATVRGFLAAPPAVSLPAAFTLDAQVEATLAVYRQLLDARCRGADSPVH